MNHVYVTASGSSFWNTLIWIKDALLAEKQRLSQIILQPPIIFSTSGASLNFTL